MNTFKKSVAEFIGVFFLTFIGGAAIINTQSDLLIVALAHGLTVALVISSLGHISGAHINPAVTIGFLVAKKINFTTAFLYFFAQILGSIFASICLLILIPNSMNFSLGGQSLNESVSFFNAIFIEMILTFFLVLSIFGVAVDNRGPMKYISGFGIGLVITIDIFAGGPLTGASMNPARTFGPSLISSNWDNHLVYWIGPICGGILASFLYDNFFNENTRNND